MIHGITSDLDTFKPLRFEPGLNIVLARKSAGASDRLTRNGAGKTSLIDIVHFLFASNCDHSSIFRYPELVNATFEMDVDINKTRITVGRSGNKPTKIQIKGNTSLFPIEPVLDKKSKAKLLSHKQWRVVLGTLLFDLNKDIDDQPRFSPTFRSMFGYFVRRHNSGGLDNPVQQSKMQQTWDQQVNISHLLNLDASVSRKFNEVRTQEKAMGELRKVAKQGDLGAFYGKAADFRTKLAIAEARTKEIQEQLTTFNVVPEYAAMEKEASTITRDISALNDENTIDREMIDQLQSAIEIEVPPASNNLERLYRETGVVLPDSVGRRFEEVADFHKAIIHNRKTHLTSEVSAAKARIEDRGIRRLKLDVRRRQLMVILNSGGALEHYARIQEEVGRLEANTESLRQRLEVAERIESTKTILDMERAQLQKSLQTDIHERHDLLKEAILVFESLSNALYERAGSLTVGATSNGPTFEVKIDSQRSKGINNMQIFCFDLMLMELAMRRGLGPGFLIHDSHLFDGVDERQIAKALQLGAQRAEEVGFQYIVTMNSDALPTEGFKGEFDVTQFINETGLTDELDTGGLFGLQFG